MRNEDEFPIWDFLRESEFDTRVARVEGAEALKGNPSDLHVVRHIHSGVLYAYWEGGLVPLIGRDGRPLLVDAGVCCGEERSEWQMGGRPDREHELFGSKPAFRVREWEMEDGDDPGSGVYAIHVLTHLSTGVQYRSWGGGLTPLLDRDGRPLLMSPERPEPDDD